MVFQRRHTGFPDVVTFRYNGEPLFPFFPQYSPNHSSESLGQGTFSLSCALTSNQSRVSFSPPTSLFFYTALDAAVEEPVPFLPVVVLFEVAVSRLF